MKVLFVKPAWNYPADKADSTYNRIWPPLDLLNCAAFLRERGHTVTVIDGNTQRRLPSEIANNAAQYDRIFITSSSLDRWQCPNINIDPFLETTKAFLAVNPNVFVMGTHGTVRPIELLQLTHARAVIQGEPEGAVVDLTEEANLSQIEGITYQSNEGIVSTPPRKPLALKDFPVPAFELVDYRHYFYEVLGERFALMETSRGCPFSCHFCVKIMYGSGCRYKTLDQMKREIAYIVATCKVRTVYFMDLEFTINRQLVLGICDYLLHIGKPFEWCCQTRADTVDTELLTRMKEAGCKIIHFGVESGSEKIANSLNKNISMREIESGIFNTQRLGIKTVCFFMVGLPNETEADMKRTLQFAIKLNPTYASFHIALPYPGTMFYSMVKDKISPALFPTAYTGEIPLEVIEKFVKRAFFLYYSRPGYLFRRIRNEGIVSILQEARFFFHYFWSRWIKRNGEKRLF